MRGIVVAAVLPFHALWAQKSHCNEKVRYSAIRMDEPPGKAKIIHFVRHAEGHHNVAGRKNPLTGYLNEKLEDACLTEEGVAQCKMLATTSPKVVEKAQLLVVSPMNRTMQTATIAFPQLQDKIPWVAVENLRERTGLHPCDRRKSVTIHKKSFPHVDFSNVKDDQDTLYWRYNLREPNSDVTARARLFMEWLKERPETEIIVVTHHGYLLDLLGEVVRTSNPSVDATDFNNCEMRTFIIKF
mmetsp:Transcript_120520/g.236885  ORF Transcript_120520/g.236885 Transcript_120520/m.236885 type:complete len:242 (-) Transcript_120520:90-815(-)